TEAQERGKTLLPGEQTRQAFPPALCITTDSASCCFPLSKIQQEHEARLKRHDNHRLSRETALVGVITELGRAREPGTGRITR
ncbi:hypothetical protein ACSLPA_33345, partial [Escherichia coli]